MALFPQSIPPASVVIGSVQPTLVSVAHSLQRQVRSRGGQRWTLKASWPLLSRSEWSPMFAFSMAQRGQYGTFTFVLPGNLSSPQGVATGTPLVNGGSQSGRSLVTDGWTPNTTGILKAGDVIKLAGNKVYMLTADVNSDSGGNATLSIEPALFVTPADNEAITVSNVPFTVSFTSDSREAPVAPGPGGGFFSLTAEMVEVP